MFRVIQYITGSLPGFRAAVHSTPRRYKLLSTAINKAVEKPGLFSIVGDANEVHAVVKNGKLLGQRPQEQVAHKGKLLGHR